VSEWLRFPRSHRMKLKTDENMPIEVAEAMRAAGHDALSVLEQDLGGWADPGIAEICRSEGRVLVSLDTDFADVRAYPPQDYPGILVIRLKRQDKPSLLEVVPRILRMLQFEEIDRRLWIVTEERVRIRGG
jgi:predicted nuclease of predicted toxin-antitoxin system